MAERPGNSGAQGRDTLDDLPAGGLLVAGALVGVAALALAPLVVGLVAFVTARLLGARWAPTLVLAVTGTATLVLVGPREALETFAAQGPVWRAAEAVEGDVGAWVAAVAPLALLGGALSSGALEAWWHVKRPFWTQRTTRRSLAARVRARRDRRAMRGGRAHSPQGVALGTDERGDLVRLAAGELGHHALVLGATGAGKTTTLLTLCHGLLPSFQANGQASRHGGLVVVDLKGDPSLVRALRDLAARHERDVRVWTFTGPDTWNPLATGDATELTDKLIGLEEWSEPHYKRGAQRYLQAVLSTLITLGRRRDLGRVVELLDVGAFSALVDRESGRGLPEGEATRLRTYLAALDKSAYSAVLGLANRLALLSESRAGELLGADEQRHQIDLRTSLEGGDVVVFSLDSQKYGETAAQLAAMVAQDLKTVAAERLVAVDAGQPPPASFVIFDEFSAVRSDQLLGLMARARGAGLGVILATQELADLSRVDPGFTDQVLGNTNVKIVHRQDVPESAERLAGVAGTQRGWQETFQTERGRLTKVGDQVVGGWHGSNTGVGTIREVESYVVHPNVLKALGQGEAVLMRKHPAVDVRRVHVAAPAAAHAEAALRRQDPLLGSPGLSSSAPAAPLTPRGRHQGMSP
ncbi:MAG: type IV secretion system DNA-binding domain-containing protein [Actinomycetota bacterium]|nr:type IV secretion system DNA-binding domain-containing protein [Actinomycetota bacterium]